MNSIKKWFFSLWQKVCQHIVKNGNPNIIIQLDALAVAKDIEQYLKKPKEKKPIQKKTRAKK